MSDNVVIELIFDSKNHMRQEYDVIATPKSKSLDYELLRTRRPIGKKLKELLGKVKSFKYREIIEVKMLKYIKDEDKNEEIKAYFSSSTMRVTSTLDVFGFVGAFDPSILEKASEKILQSFSTYIKNGSGFRYKGIESHTFVINSYDPLGGGGDEPTTSPFSAGNRAESGGSYIETPDKRNHNLSGLINIKNSDDKCFMWCHARHIRYSRREKIPQNSNRLTYKDKEVADIDLDYNGVSFPVSVDDIPRIEEQNDIQVHVFSYNYEKDAVSPIYTPAPNGEKEILRLLLLERDDKKHFLLIKDMSRVLSRKSKHESKNFMCNYCLRVCSSKERLEKHYKECLTKNDRKPLCKTKLPGTKLKFVNYGKQFMAPFVIYADFECTLESTDRVGKLNKHIPCAYAYKVVCCYDCSFNSNVVMRVRKNKDYHYFVNKFIDEMVREVEKCKTTITQEFNKKLSMTIEERRAYNMAKKCHICDGEILDNKNKVRDHCHITGAYRGAAHSKCNINYYKLSPWNIKIPVIFHNLRGYDSHFIMEVIGRYVNSTKAKDDVEVIANNTERYMSITYGNIKFIDSFQIMPASLDFLASSLSADEKVFTKSKCEEYGWPLDLMLKKGVFPYEYLDNIGKLDDKQLPPHSAFYSTIRGGNVSNEEYKRAQDVWRALDVGTLGRYLKIYLALDVLLLADVMENFRKLARILIRCPIEVQQNVPKATIGNRNV